MELEFPAVIDSTIRSAFVACPRQMFYGHVLGLRKPGTSVHLHFGAALATGLEAMRKAYWADQLDAINAVAAGVHELVRAWGDYEPPELSSTATRNSAASKTLAGCLDALLSYAEQYPLGDDHIRPYFAAGEPMIEKSFALPIPGCSHPVTGDPLLYAGRFDMIGVFNDAIFIVDEKTSGSLGSSWRNNWLLRGQFSAYCWGCRSFGIEAAGVIVRGIGILKQSIVFEQVILTRPSWQVEQWLAQMIRDVQRMIEHWRTMSAEEPHLAWDQALDSACSSYGGCPFIQPCDSHDPRNWYGEFTVGRWNPLLRSTDANT